jgi:hypothetical protein
LECPQKEKPLLHCEAGFADAAESRIRKLVFYYHPRSLKEGRITGVRKIKNEEEKSKKKRKSETNKPR